MNAVEFFKEWGYDHSKNYVELAQSEGDIPSWEVELKRLVESYEFINKHGGIDRCKDWYRSSPFKRDKYMRELKQAIADVESVGGGV